VSGVEFWYISILTACLPDFFKNTSPSFLLSIIVNEYLHLEFNIISVISYKIKLEGSKGEKKVEALFDSGSSDSLIKPEIALLLGNLEKLPDPISFETADEGAFMTVTDVVGLDFYIDGLRLRDEFLVVDNLSEDAIIGASTMQKFKMKLNFEDDRVIVDPRVTRKMVK
jgi:hypothetical protein